MADYEDLSSPQTTPPPPYIPQTSHQTSAHVADVVVYRQSPALRFWKAFSIAVLIWVLFAAFTSLFTDMAFSSHASCRFGTCQKPCPAPHDGTLHQCMSGSNWTLSNQSVSYFPYSAVVFLELPVDSDAIYIFTRGSQQSGHVDIVQSTRPTNKVGIQVLAGYHSREALDLASVCRLERRPNENGIGILTPELSGRHEIRFEVKITLPAAKNEDDTLHIKSFETETSNYNQDIGDIWNTASFDRLSLRTTNGNITAKAVTVEDGLIRSSNGAIQGHFNSGSSIELITTNGPIQAFVSLFNRENGNPSELNMRTSNSEIYVNVDLVTRSGLGGIFNVDTRTSNAPVVLEYTNIPVNGVLNSETHSSNARMSVKLHSAFEGLFEVATSNAAAVLEELPTEDPSGRGRWRAVTRRQERNYVQGSAQWGESRGRLDEGYANVRTSNGHAELVI